MDSKLLGTSIKESDHGHDFSQDGFGILGLVPAVLACRDGKAADATTPQAFNARSFDLNGTYLNAAYTHPKLINASPRDIAFIPSTSYGENFVLAALGLSSRPAPRS